MNEKISAEVEDDFERFAVGKAFWDAAGQTTHDSCSEHWICSTAFHTYVINISARNVISFTPTALSSDPSALHSAP